MGYIEAWKLTPKGSVLAGVFHESDILIAEAISQGLFDGLKPTDLAAAVSCVVYERRNSDQDDLPYPSTKCREVAERVEDLSMEVQDLQTAHGLPVHRFPDPNFAQCAALWASGKSLTSVLDTVPEMSPGDFVRTIRQIVDLLRQIERIGLDQTLRESARIAGEAMFRGIVVGNEAL
jgi:ATP-dependent RNA helicase HelY